MDEGFEVDAEPYDRTFVRFETRVDDLPSAWAYVMKHVDKFKSPNIEIHGMLGCWDGLEKPMRIAYEVGVFGDVEGGW